MRIKEVIYGEAVFAKARDWGSYFTSNALVSTPWRTRFDEAWARYGWHRGC